MKTLLIRCTIVVILTCIFSCAKDAKKQKSLISKSMVSLTDTCFSSDFKIYKETAYLWQKTWADQYGRGTSAQINFSLDSIQKLRSFDSISRGVRLYYCLPNENDTLPSLAMVNINGCDDQVNCNQDNCILFSQLATSKNEYFINDSILNVYRDRWETYINSKRGIHTPVYAYNYEWSSMENMIDNTVLNPGVWVKYGFRTLSPGDTLEFGQASARSNSSTITGSIVYCNIVYGQSPVNSVNELFDFAKPCPRYCNGIENW